MATTIRRPSALDLVALGCDTMVALPGATRDGCAIFAKNSDRPATECQPLVRVEGRRHPRGSQVQCQYLSIPQVERTYTFVGAQPHWLWGLEHGVNECQVAIGNEAVYTRDPLPETGLLGMDLVRLGLERGDCASQALEVMTELLETYGQGGVALPDTDVGYHNSFLVADAREAWILETSGRRWAARRVQTVGSISNHLTLHDDWETGSADLERHAIEQGWWSPDRGRLAFDSAYRDRDTVPVRMSEGRLARSRCLLEDGAGGLTERRLIDFLRDHGESGAAPPEHRDPESVDFFTICFHLEPLLSTTAGIVARLRTQPDGLPDLWACLGSPCMSVFLPVYLDADLPAALSVGGTETDAGSPWWRFKALRDGALSPDAGPSDLLARAQSCWREWEDQLFQQAADLAPELLSLEVSGQVEAARTIKSRLTARAVEGTMERLASLGF